MSSVYWQRESHRCQDLAELVILHTLLEEKGSAEMAWLHKLLDSVMPHSGSRHRGAFESVDGNPLSPLGECGLHSLLSSQHCLFFGRWASGVLGTSLADPFSYGLVRLYLFSHGSSKQRGRRLRGCNAVLLGPRIIF